jgi:hypothetical protein
MALDTGTPFPAPKKWKRVDVGETECYVGDELYAIALVEKQPGTVEELVENQSHAETTVIKYLQGEGFLGKEYVYVGMQRFSLKHPTKGFNEAEGLPPDM